MIDVSIKYIALIQTYDIIMCVLVLYSYALSYDKLYKLCKQVPNYKYLVASSMTIQSRGNKHSNTCISSASCVLMTKL